MCVFNLVATPYTNTSAGNTNLGTANCYRVEWVIWDSLLNENFKVEIAGGVAVGDPALRSAGYPARPSDSMNKVQGSMAIPMGAVCAARETARRALLLWFFDQT